ncbi:hypothetical protein YH63_002055 [Afipia massiliensis]|uniref:Rad50/SbcC-type AAA domain-containing protein n=1 Tax=Afipia massiliensis TaxID=211460 RepID=A0A4U6BKH3_9BRAD|nr:hypothetical protein [Afipia massiliensis]TKT70291.1 hypothetical protein YH63_002055 [Afipia massiliensis]
MQLREIRLTGAGKLSASVKFEPGANVLAGLSNTGKSYMLRCMDYVLGASEMTKKIDEDAGYELVHLEFAGANNEPLTLIRHLTGGDIKVHYSRIDSISGDGTTVAWKRRPGKSAGPDISSIFLSFAGMKEAQLRSNAKGKTQRLTVRTLLPAFLVDETSIIAESSPMFGNSGYDQTARKRLLSYLLTGIDDEGIISAERSEIAQAEARAKLALISELLKPIEQRLEPFRSKEQESTIERVDEAIERLSNSLAEDREERARLHRDRSEAIAIVQNAESQLIAIDELLSRYNLLTERYDSDLQRLDFIAEGSHFLGGLQEARCPVCDQPMNDEHRHKFEGYAKVGTVYKSAQSEAAKILGLRNELVDTISSLGIRRGARETERATGSAALAKIDARVEQELAPALRVTKLQLDELIARRLELENLKSDSEQANALNTVRESLESTLVKPISAPKDWASIDEIAVHKFCLVIEKVLKEWAWDGPARVEFDHKRFDIKVDGKPRQSNGKGVRAILHAAFAIGLLRFCHENSMPHPGFLVLDSPLTTFKEGRDEGQEDPNDSVGEGIQTAFWASIAKLQSDLQIIVLDNKEPPKGVAAILAYTFFPGKKAKDGERKGFIPK